MRGLEHQNIRLKILLPFALILLLIIALFISFGYSREKRAEENAQQELEQMVTRMFEQYIQNDINLMRLAIDPLLKNSAVRIAFQQRDMEALYQVAYQGFEELRERYRINEFYFITPEQKVLLRVHQSSRRGDTINRLTLLKSKESRETVYGLELGSYGGLMLRVVTPWYIDGSLIGYIELAQNVEHVLAQIAEGHDINLVTVVRKKYLEREGWEIAQKFLSYQRVDWDQLKRGVVVGSTLDNPSIKLHSLIDLHQQQEYGAGGHESFSMEYVEGDQHMRVSMCPILDFGEHDIGDIVIIQDVSDQYLSFRSALQSVSLLSAFSGLLIFILFFRILGKVQQEIAQYNQTLLEAKEDAESANHAKDDFLASMSHELRTPLTAIIGSSELLLENSVSPEEEEELICAIKIAGRSQLNLVNDILDMSKIESGKFTIDETPYNLSSLVDQIRYLFAIRARDGGINFEVEQQIQPLFQLIGDQQRIDQILVNLIGNAFKFTDMEGKIRVTICREGEKLCFQVKDSGVGMAPEVVAKLFQRFEQGDRQISTRFGGSGLGLYISSNLAEMMGGKIEVESREGEGSLFTLRLPYRESEYRAYAIEIGAGLAAQPTVPQYQGVVLVAEDAPALQLLAEKMLQLLGIEVVIASNGAEAVEQALRRDFDLILMDMQMPVMDGLEATQRLRSMGVQTPIVALTANVMEKHREAFREVGGDGFLNKPIERHKLWKILRKHLRFEQKLDDSYHGLSSETAAAEKSRAPYEDPVKQAANSGAAVVDGLDAGVVNELMATFAETMGGLRKEMVEGLSNSDWDAVYKAAHVIKGSGTAFGYPVLTRCGTRVCKEISEEAFEQAVTVTGELLDKLDEVLADL